jgi:transcriptional regulator with XRE-family HTH domain
MMIRYDAPVGHIGAAIKAKRKPLMTQGAFAAKLGLTQPSISAWEREESQPTADLLPRIAVVLQCSVDDLVSGIDPAYDKHRDLPRHGVGVKKVTGNDTSTGVSSEPPARHKSPPEAPIAGQSIPAPRSLGRDAFTELVHAAAAFHEVSTLASGWHHRLSALALDIGADRDRGQTPVVRGASPKHPAHHRDDAGSAHGAKRRKRSAS